MTHDDDDPYYGYFTEQGRRPPFRFELMRGVAPNTPKGWAMILGGLAVLLLLFAVGRLFLGETTTWMWVMIVILVVIIAILLLAARWADEEETFRHQLYVRERKRREQEREREREDAAQQTAPPQPETADVGQQPPVPPMPHRHMSIEELLADVPEPEIDEDYL